MLRITHSKATNSPKKSQAESSLFVGQVIENQRYGEGIICLINIHMRNDLEIGTEVIVRYRNDPKGVTRTYHLPTDRVAKVIPFSPVELSPAA